MSWDYDTYTKPCSCGKGLIEVVYGSNDWGKTSHDETILSPLCNKKLNVKLLRNRKEKELQIEKSTLR